MQRDVLRELAQLVRFYEADGHNIGPFVAEHACELAHLLSSHESELRDAIRENDGALVDRLGARLAIAHETERQQRHERDVERAHRAARELGRTARWFERGVVLDVDLVLGDLLADNRCKFVRLHMLSFIVRIPTEHLRRARLLRTYIDLVCYLDARGIHLRWKAGRGQLNLHSVKADAHTVDALVIDLPPRERGPALVADVLATMGFGAR